MKFFDNLAIRYKILVTFLLIFLIVLGFDFYISSSLTAIQTSTNDLDISNQKLSNLLELDLANKRLNVDVGDFILTKNTKDEDNYDVNTQRFDDLMTKLQATATDTNTKNELQKTDELSNKIRGAELLILSKVREGHTQEAQGLFDTVYYKEQIQLTNLISDQVSKENSTVAAIVQKNSQIVSSVRTFLYILLIVTAIAIVALSFFISTIISRPFSSLVIAASQIAAGNVDTRANFSSNDEIGKLGRAFNDMASKIQELYKGLEQKVKEKTGELELSNKQLAEKVSELEKINNLMVGRELEMVKLKQNIEDLKNSAEK